MHRHQIGRGHTTAASATIGGAAAESLQQTSASSVQQVPQPTLNPTTSKTTTSDKAELRSQGGQVRACSGQQHSHPGQQQRDPGPAGSAAAEASAGRAAAAAPPPYVPTAEQRRQLDAFVAFLLEENEKHNLTGASCPPPQRPFMTRLLTEQGHPAWRS